MLSIPWISVEEILRFREIALLEFVYCDTSSSITGRSFTNLIRQKMVREVPGHLKSFVKGLSLC